MKNYPYSFYRCIKVFNSYEKKECIEWNEIPFDSEDEEKSFIGFSAEAENVMAKDNADFAEYLYNNCKSFRRNIDTYSNEAFEMIYCNFNGSRFNLDCFDFKGFSEIENNFIEKHIDKNFAIERQFDVNNGIANIYYYSKAILHNWIYTARFAGNTRKFEDMQEAFRFMERQGYIYCDKDYSINERFFYFYEKGIAAKHGCKLPKAIEKEYGRFRGNMPCLIETEE